MNLLEFLQSLDHKARKAFAAKCDTSLDYLWQIANGIRQPKVQLAVAITRFSNGVVPCEKLLPDVDWAYVRQHLEERAA